MDSSNFFSPEITNLLAKSGWFPGRNIAKDLELPSDVEYPAHIVTLLQEFGKLSVRSIGAGINAAKNSIDFDPTWAEQESSEDGKLHYYSNLIGTSLYPIGYIPQESLILCIDNTDKTYMAGDNLYWIGNSFTEGISNILLGISGKTLNENKMHWMD